ncbi:MAG: hypothetical protein MUP04_08120 [Anaerolineae bacterium]|nr:hypothetical protein [Anaerolineae bacterium]
MIFQRYHQAAKVGLLLIISGLLLLSRRPLSFARPSVAPAITITQPDGILDVVGEGEDFATTVLGAPWEMNSSPYPDFPTVMGSFDRGSFSVSGGIWDAYTLNYDPGVMIHPIGLAQPVMKDGSRFPIEASKYRLLSFRMYSSQGYTPGSGYVAYVYWFYEPTWPGSKKAWTGLIKVSPGWKTYVIDLETYTLGGTEGGATGWDGLVKGLRIDPVAQGSNVNIKFDWIRLTTDTFPTFTITWSATDTSIVELFIDDNNSGCDGTAISGDLSAGSGSFDWGASLLPYGDNLLYPLPSSVEPGQYYVYATLDHNYATCYHSSGPLTINQAPMVEIARPSRTSGEDYATTVVGNPWDMNGSPDIASTGHIAWSQYSGGVYDATSDSSGDPGLTLNVSSAIDSNRYRYLTFRMLLDGAQDIGGGWVARAIWWGAGGPANAGVIDDIVIYEGWQTYTLDLAQAALEYGPPWTTGSWTTFRLDPHEVAASRTVHLDYVLLTANDQADAYLNIAWSVSDIDIDDSFTTNLYYDSDTDWDNGKTFIVQLPVSPSPPAGPYLVYLPLAFKDYGASTSSLGYSWDTSVVSAGTYYLWVEITDGYNTTRWVSESPVVISH